MALRELRQCFPSRGSCQVSGNTDEWNRAPGLGPVQPRGREQTYKQIDPGANYCKTGIFKVGGGRVRWWRWWLRKEEGCVFQREQPVQRHGGLKEHSGLCYK